MPDTVIYKIVTRGEWEAAQADGLYRGSAHDARDGFIHLSTAAQLAETARKYFSGVPDLVLLAIETSSVERPPHPTLSPRGEGFSGPALSPNGEGSSGVPSPPPHPLADMATQSRNLASARLRDKDRLRGDSPLRWEPSRGGDLFPHLYADLPAGAVVSTRAIPLGEDGVPIIPGDLAP